MSPPPCRIYYLYKKKRTPLVLGIDEAQYLNLAILKEISDYIFHKLTLAGGSRDILEPSAVSAAHSYSQGNPRLIDNLMCDALALGAQLDKRTIDSETMLAAVNNQSL